MGRMGIEEITVQALLPLAIRGIVVSPLVSTMIQLVSVTHAEFDVLNFEKTFSG